MEEVKKETLDEDISKEGDAKTLEEQIAELKASQEEAKTQQKEFEARQEELKNSVTGWQKLAEEKTKEIETLKADVRPVATDIDIEIASLNKKVDDNEATTQDLIRLIGLKSDKKWEKRFNDEKEMINKRFELDTQSKKQTILNQFFIDNPTLKGDKKFKEYLDKIPKQDPNDVSVGLSSALGYAKYLYEKEVAEGIGSTQAQQTQQTQTNKMASQGSGGSVSSPKPTGGQKKLNARQLEILKNTTYKGKPLYQGEDDVYYTPSSYQTN